ncbi:MAG: response regulator [Elusimicrobia bacterium]|nr:response regulator [Elusimicrobiota bacterium]
MTENSLTTGPEAQKKKILIVEDSKNTSEALKAVLEAEGRLIFLARDGVTGLALAHREKPDLILLDLLLPKLNGYEVCAALKRDNTVRHIPILIISTMDSPESVERAKICGAKNFMKKPYNLEDLLREIKKLLLE